MTDSFAADSDSGAPQNEFRLRLESVDVRDAIGFVKRIGNKHTN